MKQTIIVLVAALLFLEWSAGYCTAQTSGADTKAIGVAEAVKELPNSIKTPNRYALVIGTLIDACYSVSTAKLGRSKSLVKHMRC